MKKRILIYVFLIAIYLIIPISNIKASDDYPCPGITAEKYLKASYSTVCEYSALIKDKNAHIIIYNLENKWYSYGSGYDAFTCWYYEGATTFSGTSYWISDSIDNLKVKIYYGSLSEYYEIGERNGPLYTQNDCPKVRVYPQDISAKLSSEPEGNNPTNNSGSYKGKEIKIMYIVGMALLIIRIIVPLLLIVTGMIGLIKSMTKNDDRDIKAELKKLVPKLIAAIIIFILPTLVALLMRLTNKTSLWNDYSKCLLTPTKCNVKLWED